MTTAKAALTRTLPRALTALAAAWAALPAAAPAQAPVHPVHPDEIEGVVRDLLTGEPLAGALVSVAGLSTLVRTHGDGSFHFTGIAEGEHLVRVERLGYLTRAVEVVVGEGTGFVEVGLSASPIGVQGVVVSASLTPRGAAEALRPVSVMAGGELQRRMQGTIGETLRSVPGLEVASMGPGVGRPVIRGLSGDRVLLLEDGSRVGDVSGMSGDHATAVDPLSARRVEVIRGPAALLYGSNALGGIVNVIRDEIPSRVPHHFTGSASVMGQTASGSVSGAGSAVAGLGERTPLRFEFSGRTGGDLRTPAGTLANTSVDTWSAAAGAAYVGDRGRIGGSVRSYRNNHGIPGGFTGGHAKGVLIEMQRFQSKLQAELENPFGPFASIRFDAGHSLYEHSEIEPPDIPATWFGRELLSGDVLGRHGGWGPFSGGALGVRASWEDLDFGEGEGGRSSGPVPDSRRLAAAAYLFEEIELGPVKLEGGARYDWVHVNPLQRDPDSEIGPIRERTFHAASASLGALYRAGSGLSVGASLARAFRTPDVNELYSQGPHLAVYAFEVGNPSLGTERGAGADVFARFESPRARFEAAAFYNRVSGYIFGEETGRLSRVLLPIYQFQSRNAVLTGFEGSLDADLGAGLALHGTASYVRGSITESDMPLPLIPPLRGRVGLEFERPAWFVGGEVEMSARQDRIGAFEEATDGYAVFNAAAGLRVTVAGRLNILAASLDNATNKEYRNHLSRVKEIMPEAGRGLTVSYRVVF